jgi:hypothetical protein
MEGENRMKNSRLIVRIAAWSIVAAALCPSALAETEKRFSFGVNAGGGAITWMSQSWRAGIELGLRFNKHLAAAADLSFGALTIENSSSSGTYHARDSQKWTAMPITLSLLYAEPLSENAAIYLRDQIGMFLADHLASDPDVYFPFAYSPSDPGYLNPDCLVIEHLVNGLPYCHKRNLGEFLYPLRMVKDQGEITLIKQAVAITKRGALAGIAALRPGLYEYEIQQTIEDTFQALGAPRTSFASIIGSGPNSLVLHYFENNRKMEAGDVVVMDVGAEYGRYAGDITRTAPVSGQFTPRQREVYEIVLEIQRRVFAACRPGVTLLDLNNVAKAWATEKGYGAYFNFSGWRHSTCHSLGLDAHDPFTSGRPLAAGMVITVEPGIYLPAENLGVRIEDDVRITENAGVVLTADVPREAAEIEAVIAGRFQPKYESRFERE